MSCPNPHREWQYVWDTILARKLDGRMTICVDISSSFDVKLTEHSGRACFARTDMEGGTTVLHVEKPLAYSICYEFSKEVCHSCFRYAHGKYMKFKVEKEDIDRILGERRTRWYNTGLWFCSLECKETYLAIENVGELLEAFLVICEVYQRMARQNKRQTKGEMDESRPSSIDQAWEEVEKVWIPSVEKMKASKRMNDIPQIDEEHYCCARFMAMSLHSLKYLRHTSPTYEAFSILQSNESEKIHAFPELLEFQIRTFQFLYILLPQTLKSQLSIDLFRDILGREYGNSFGIWEENAAADTREYLGYANIPEASFFNHSCIPNVTRKRVGNSMVFFLNRNVRRGEELSIEYKGILGLPVKERRSILKANWFFECNCSRCVLELQSVH